MTPRMRARRHEDGASAVEFALLFTFVLAPLLFGLIQYGMYFYATNAASSAAREALRRAVVGDCQTDTEVTTLVKNQTQGAAEDDSDSPTTGTIEYLDPGTENVITDPEVGDEVRITVELKAMGVGAFIPQPHGGNITREAVGRLEDLEKLSATACQ
ncbi:MAG: TadE family protein [Nocardioidaceae bacterium]